MTTSRPTTSSALSRGSRDLSQVAPAVGVRDLDRRVVPRRACQETSVRGAASPAPVPGRPLVRADDQVQLVARALLERAGGRARRARAVDRAVRAALHAVDVERPAGRTR